MWRLNHFWRGFVSVPRALARQFECEKSKPPFDSRLFEDFGVHQSVMSSSGRTSVAVLPTRHVRIEEGAELAARPPRYELRCESKISFRDSSVRNSNAIASTVGSADSCLEPALSRYEVAAVIYATGADRGMKTPKPVAVLNSGCCQRSGVCARSTGPHRARRPNALLAVHRTPRISPRTCGLRPSAAPDCGALVQTLQRGER
jgi:hypothetical protein